MLGVARRAHWRGPVLGSGMRHCTLAPRAISASCPDIKQRRRENFVGRQPSVLEFCNSSPAGSKPPSVYSFAPAACLTEAVCMRGERGSCLDGSIPSSRCKKTDNDARSQHVQREVPMALCGSCRFMVSASGSFARFCRSLPAIDNGLRTAHTLREHIGT